MSILKTEQVSVGYQQHLILKALSIQIPKGQITTLIGPNGSGKSTLIRTIARLLKPASGTVLLNDQNLAEQNPKVLAQSMAVLPQTGELMSDLTVTDLVAFGRIPYRKPLMPLSANDQRKIDWAIERTGLVGFENRFISTLSGGQRQRAWIAMALAQDTEILILDEPTTYLDLTHQLEIMLLIQDLNQKEGRTIIMALHDLNHAARFSDQLIALKDGQLQVSGSVQEVMTQTNLRQIFNIDATLVAHAGRPLILTYDRWNGAETDE